MVEHGIWCHWLEDYECKKKKKKNIIIIRNQQLLVSFMMVQVKPLWTKSCLPLASVAAICSTSKSIWLCCFLSTPRVTNTSCGLIDWWHCGNQLVRDWQFFCCFFLFFFFFYIQFFYSFNEIDLNNTWDARWFSFFARVAKAHLGKIDWFF